MAAPPAPEHLHVPHIDLDPFSAQSLSAPHGWYGVLQDAGPVVWLDSYGVYASARYAEVADALKRHDTFCSSRGVGLSDFAHETPWRPPSLLLETDPPHHAQTRAIMNRIVSPAAIKVLRATWAEKAADLVEELVSRRRFDAVVDLAEEFPMRVFPDTIGLQENGRENLLPYACAVFNGFGPRNALTEDTLAQTRDAAAWVTEACRRENLRPGGWGMAVYEAVDNGLCSEDDAQRLVRSFISAGVDTTVNGIGNMMAAFVQFPGEWEKLRSKPALRTKAFEEALRWDSTVQWFFRTTAHDAELGGALIPEGSKILLCYAAANRDPRRWVEPDRFNIERMCSGHVAFGYGIHQCLGQMVARLEADVLLEALTARVAAIRPAGPAVRRLNNTLHALASLPIEVDPV
ncbi:MAG: cytochrome P450 [Sphingomonas hengshuiensis]|uniref:Cytochrome P450 n=1 Tax=Sphingomonas hengshuiensis TaxID=1609977 RepID=A0A2W5AVE6_9SPHN|nr:MAG: cytochrome P450 [Sphingomonas hengshuiensis]